MVSQAIVVSNFNTFSTFVRLFIITTSRSNLHRQCDNAHQTGVSSKWMMLVYRRFLLALAVAALMLTQLMAAPPSQEVEERLHRRKKRPCSKTSPEYARTFFGLTFLLGDLVVNQEYPCNGGSTGGEHQPLFGGNRPLLGGHRPLLGGHRPLFGGHRPLFGGLTGLFGSGVKPTVETHIENYKPIFEEVEEDEVQEDYKPEAVVGAPSQQVNGFMQDLTNLRPDKIVNRIGKQFNTYLFNPFVDLFY